jgi:hypothetical protein
VARNTIQDLWLPIESLEGSEAQERRPPGIDRLPTTEPRRRWRSLAAVSPLQPRSVPSRSSAPLGRLPGARRRRQVRPRRHGLIRSGPTLPALASLPARALISADPDVSKRSNGGTRVLLIFVVRRSHRCGPAGSRDGRAVGRDRGTGSASHLTIRAPSAAARPDPDHRKIRCRDRRSARPPHPSRRWMRAGATRAARHSSH